jgi:flagellar motility protein MotE (MotC chaperone)
MIRRITQARLRLVDAVALAAMAVLALKLVELFAAPAAPPGISASGPASGFFRAIAHARSNHVVPDVTMTGAVPDRKSEDKKPDSAGAAAPDEPRGKRPVEFLTQPGSPAERALFERLGERREEIQQKGRELEMRERLLENAERRLETRLNELKGAEDKAGEAQAKRGDTEAGAIRNLVTMYEAMKPKDAARVFDRLGHDVLVPVVMQMNPRKMSEVLAVMSPEAAEKLTVALATRSRAAAAPAAAAAAVLPSTEPPAIEPPPMKPAR